MIFRMELLDADIPSPMRNSPCSCARFWVIGSIGAVLLASAVGVTSAQTVTLKGQTRLPQLPDGQVTVHIGDQQSAHVADVTGAFSVEVELPSDSRLVRIEACGVGEQSEICHARLVHTAAEIQTRAGADGVYKVGDLSPLSTAAWGALVNALGGSLVPTAFAQIEAFRRGFGGSRILSDAVILSLLAESGALLPGDADSLIDIALDRSLIDMAADQFSDEEFATRFEALIQLDHLMLQPDVDFMITGSGYFTARRFNSSGDRAFWIDLTEPGTGQYVEIRGSGTVEWTNVDAGELIFADDMEAVGTGTRYVSLTASSGESIIPPRTFFFLPPGESAGVEGQIQLAEVQWRALDASELLPLFLLRTIDNNVAPNRPDLDPDQIANLGVQSFEFVSLGRSNRASIPPSPVPVAGTSWAYPRCDPDCQSQAGLFSGANLDLIRFNNDGTATSAIADPGLAWQESGQRTLIEQGDGISLEILPFGSTAPHIGDLDTTLIVTKATRPDGQTFMSSQLSLEADPTFAFSPDTIPGRYQSMSPFGGVFVLEPDGTGWQASLEDPAAPRPDTGGFDIEWSIEPTGDLLLSIKIRGADFLVALWSLRPVRETPAGFYTINRLDFDLTGAAVNSGGTLLFWREVR